MSSGTANPNRGVFIVALGVGLALAAVIVYLQLGGMGTPVKISPNETVHYSGAATEAQAKALGASLQEIGFFGQGRKVDVLLKKDDAGTTVSFVVSPEGWTNAGNEHVFRLIGASIAPSVGGKPIKVNLLDDKLNIKKEIVVDVETPTRVRISEKEGVMYSGTATEEEAKALGKALQEAGYFMGSHHIDATLRKGPQGTIVSFIGQAEVWSTPEAAEEFTTIGQAIAPSIGGKPIKLHLLDMQLKLLKEIEIK